MRKKLRVLNPVGHKEIAFGYLSQNGNMKRMDSGGGGRVGDGHKVWRKTGYTNLYIQISRTSR